MQNKSVQAERFSNNIYFSSDKLRRRELVKLPGNLSIKMNIRVIGLPVDLSYGGYLMAQDDINISNSIGQLLKEAADQIRDQFKGVTLVLNSDKDIWKGYTLSLSL